jgi:replicative DNA helicase
MENFKNINPVKVDKSTIISLEKGKLQPQAIELEAVLGAMMIDKRVDVIDI